MPKISPDNLPEKVTGVAGTVENMLANLVITTNPVVITGVNRKTNIGNFENIDLFLAIAIPMTTEASLEDPEAFEAAITRAAEVGFGAASRETWNRYEIIKASQEG
jgi:hypothetical protein